MIPAIGPVPDDEARPRWSVMIPAYRADLELLRRALESVLAQAPGPAQMQIEVVDDGSGPGDGAEELVAKIGDGRVEWFTQPANVGAPANFTTCVERARGRWVHILHADDAVLPGFYDTYGDAIDAHPYVVAVAGQAFVVDAADRYLGVTPVLPIVDGLIADAPRVIAMQHPMNFAATVVARDAYERVGGFDTELVHANDWEMWSRLATLGPIAGVATPLAFYRRHAASDSTRLQRSGRYLTDTLAALDIVAARFDDAETQRQVRRAGRALVRGYAFGVASGHLAEGRSRLALVDAVRGLRVAPSIPAAVTATDLAVRAVAARARRLRRPARS